MAFPSDSSLREQFCAHKDAYASLAQMLALDNNIICIKGGKLSFVSPFDLHTPEELNFPKDRFAKYSTLLGELQTGFLRDYQGNLSFMHFRKDASGTVRGWGVKWMENPYPDLTLNTVDKFKPNPNDATDVCFSNIEGNWYLCLSQTNP